jgi:homoserine dehydrogenase
VARTIRIGLIGCGVVGTGLFRVLAENGELIETRLGAPLEVVRVAVRDPSRERSPVVPTDKLTSDVDAILEDPEIDVVVELVGGVERPFQWLKTAMERGKHVVTANKAVMAERGEELIAIAEQRGVDLIYEGAVAGGVPILRVLREAFASDRVVELRGIVNGTSNYILSRMSDSELTFAEALAEAQAKGYAEADPSLDVNGGDACHKLTLLTRLAFGAKIAPADIPTEGIDIVDARDMELARRFGYVIKPLAVASIRTGALDVRVHPALVPSRSDLAAIHGATNAVHVEGALVGPTMFSGAGAGAEPTAVSVVADIIDVARNILADSAGRVAPGCVLGIAVREYPRLRPEELVVPYYLRLSVEDDAGVLAEVASALGQNRVSIEAVVQTVQESERSATIVLLTHEARETDMRAALEVIGQMRALREPPVLFRIVK